MAKQITRTEKGTGRKYRPISRWIALHYNGKDELYFIYRNRRIKVNNLCSLSYPIMIDDLDGKLTVIGYYETLCNWGCRLYEIHPDCEYIRIWEAVEED